MEGIKKIIKERDENGKEIEVEITEYPDIPVILVEDPTDLDTIIEKENNV